MSTTLKVGTLEALCGMKSIQGVCVDFFGLSTRLLAESYATEVRKVYNSIHVTRTDAEVIDRFIDDINDTYIPVLEGRVREVRKDLCQFFDSTSFTTLGVNETTGNPDAIEDVTFTLTEKGKQAVQRNVLSETTLSECGIKEV